MGRRTTDVSEADLERARESVGPFSRALTAARREAGAGASVIAWLSDLHVHAPEEYAKDLNYFSTHANSEANVKLALTEIAALDPAPELFVLGGDITDAGATKGGPDQFGTFSQIFARFTPARMRTLPLLGNHDHWTEPLPQAFHEAYEKMRRPNWPTPVEKDDFYYEERLEGWRLIAIDSMGAPLNHRQRLWLGERLKTGGREPIILLIHRPFVTVGNWVDLESTFDIKTFDLIDACDRIKLVMSGHTHKSAGWMYRRKIHAVFPACAYGIGEAPGWGCAVVSATGVHSIWVKEIAGNTFDHVTWTLEPRPGGFRRLETPLFENSPMCHPWRMRRHDEAAQRD